MNLSYLTKTHKIRVTAELGCGDIVEGYLTILSEPFEQLEAGFYVSNKGGAPFAYKVNKSQVNVIVSKTK